MRRLTTSHRVVLLRYGAGLVAVAALVGCGARTSAATVAASPAAATSSHAITATRSGTSRSAAGVAIDRRIARDAELRRSDFPVGWVSTPRPAPTSRTCPTVRQARAAVSARGASREFAQGSASSPAATADSVAYIYADPATAAHWFARLTGRGNFACLVRVLRESVLAQTRGQGARLDSITARPLTVAPAGDERAAERVVVRLSAGTFSGKAEADVIFLRTGRGVEVLVVNRVGAPFDPALETKLVRALSDRLAAGPAGTE
jgi:hypothetical protein